MNPEMKLVPYGILEVMSGMFSIFFGTSFETGDIGGALERGIVGFCIKSTQLGKYDDMERDKSSR